MENEEYKGYTIKIENDENSESPREWDNIGKMVCFHKRYELGDKTNLKSNDFNSWEEIRNYLVKEEKAVVIIPLKLYDHSGITIYCADSGAYHQHEAWDSGYIGFIYATADKIKKEYSVKRITKQLKNKVEKILRNEVETYDKYITGQVVGFTVESENDDWTDSCWGYYDIADAIAEAKSSIDYRVKELNLKREAKTKGYIKNHVAVIYRG